MFRVSIKKTCLNKSIGPEWQAKLLPQPMSAEWLVRGSSAAAALVKQTLLKSFSEDILFFFVESWAYCCIDRCDHTEFHGGPTSSETLQHQFTVKHMQPWMRTRTSGICSNFLLHIKIASKIVYITYPAKQQQWKERQRKIWKTFDVRPTSLGRSSIRGIKKIKNTITAMYQTTGHS